MTLKLVNFCIKIHQQMFVHYVIKISSANSWNSFFVCIENMDSSSFTTSSIASIPLRALNQSKSSVSPTCENNPVSVEMQKQSGMLFSGERIEQSSCWKVKPRTVLYIHLIATFVSIMFFVFDKKFKKHFTIIRRFFWFSKLSFPFCRVRCLFVL